MKIQAAQSSRAYTDLSLFDKACRPPAVISVPVVDGQLRPKTGFVGDGRIITEGITPESTGIATRSKNSHIHDSRPDYSLYLALATSHALGLDTTIAFACHEQTRT